MKRVRRHRRSEEKNPTVEEALRKYWGYDEFRPMQREIIDSISAGRDTLALLPTGGGKSLTYQVPALTLPGVCIVVTPLIALMKDQVDRLRQLGIPAIAIHSGLSAAQIDVALDNCIYGDVKILYVAPERLASRLFQLRVNNVEISFIAVDEAHCISQWGYDFRPSYLKIGEFRKEHPTTPILALTASATNLVCSDIMKNLNFKEPHILRGDFSRPNLCYAIRYVEDKTELMLRILRSVKGSAIVYMRTRKGCEQVADLLNKSDEDAVFYHGGLPHTERSIRQDEWISGEYRVMVATNAFGMGIDKPDVRVIIHYAMCDSLEAYYQEAGRAGRDGVRSYAVLMVSPDDVGRIQKRLNKNFPSLENIKIIYDKICSSLEIPYGEGGDSGYNFNFKEFCANERIYSGMITSAMKLLQMNGYMTMEEEMSHPTRIMFTMGRDELYRARITHQEVDSFIRILLRVCNGVFNDFVAIDEVYISTISGYTIPRINEFLKQLWRLRIIKYIPTNYSAMIYLESHRLPITDLYISPESYKYRKELYSERLGNMIQYSENNDICRSRMMEEYFGVIESKDCGVCDICIASRAANKTIDNLREKIIQVVGDPDEPPITIKGVAAALNTIDTNIVQEVDTMLDDGVITVDASGYLRRSRR